MTTLVALAILLHVEQNTFGGEEKVTTLLGSSIQTVFDSNVF